jgi:hypothetical protein
MAGLFRRATALIRRFVQSEEDRTIWGQTQEGEDRPTVGSDGGGNGTLLSSWEASETIERLRSGIDQASRAMRDLTQVAEHWAHGVQYRARSMAKELRGQGIAPSQQSRSRSSTTLWQAWRSLSP